MASILRRAVAALMFVSLIPLGCGSAEVGEECDDIGESDECEDDAICTNEDTGGVCRWICTEDEHCPPDHDCNGVSGTNVKSCHPRK